MVEARGRGQLDGVVLGPPGSDDGAGEQDRRLRPAGGLRRQRAGHLAAVAGGSPHRLRRASAATSRSRTSRAACSPRARWPARASSRPPSCRARSRAQTPRTRSASATRRRAPRPRRSARGRPGRTAGRRGQRRAAAGHERAQRQVLRLPVRGRDDQGHPPERQGGLRLDRALQALHHRHDGPLPGPHVPAARGAPDGGGDRHQPGRGGHHHRAPALARRADGRARRPSLRARQALVDPRPPPRAGRQRALGRRLAPRLRLRRPARRGARGARGRRADRRVDARQADRARPRRRRVARPAVPEPLLEPQAGPDPLRRDRERRRADHRRRHDLPAGRRLVLRDHHVERRGRHLRVVHLVARRLGPRRAHHRRDPGALGREPRRPARARDHPGPDRARLLGRGVHLPRRQARRGGRRALPDPADRLRGRGGLRDPLRRGARRAPLGRAAATPAPRTGSGPSASSHSGCCAYRRCTSSWARTPTPSRTRSAPRCPGS